MVQKVPVRVFVRKTQLISILTGLCIGFALAYFWSKSIGYGFICGALASVVNFQLMAVDAFEIAEKSPNKAKKFIYGRYVIRYAILFGFLAVLVTRTDFNILSAFVGIFFVQFILFTGQVLQATNIRK